MLRGPLSKLENGNWKMKNGKWKTEIGKWKSETRSGMAPIGNAILLDDKTRNHVMLENVIVTLRGQQCFRTVLRATVLPETFQQQSFLMYGRLNVRLRLYRSRRAHSTLMP